VILQADSQLSTLIDFHYQQHYLAKRGQHGKGSNKEGRSASDLIIPLPVGTIVRDAASGETIRDFIQDGESFIIARGGSGGRGNARFVTPIHQAPRHAEPGCPGEAHWLLLELKLLADVGILGYPNAGKSTLISKISAVRPKIAQYPFTTLVPHLGVVQFQDHLPFVVADIPGIIEGAHQGVGLGLKFLRHVERTTLILHLLDISDATQRQPIEDYQNLNRELGLYNTALAAKPQIVAVNKIDTPEAGRKLPEVLRYFKKIRKEIYPISALTGEGLLDLLASVARHLSRRAQEEKSA
jgi:GTP-binding protein